MKLGTGVRKTLSAVLSCLITFSSLGPNVVSAAAQGMARSRGTKVNPTVLPGVNRIAPASLTQSLGRPRPGVGTLPRLASPVKSLPAPTAPGANSKPNGTRDRSLPLTVAVPSVALPDIQAADAGLAPGLEPGVVNNFESMMGRLQQPSLLEGVPDQAPGETSRDAARNDFSLRLGEKVSAGASTVEGVDSNGTQRLSPAAPREIVAEKSIPTGRHIERRSSSFPLALSAITAAAGAVFAAAAVALPMALSAVLPGAGEAISLVFMTAGAVAGTAAAGTSVWTVSDFVSLKKALKKGEKISDGQFEEYLRKRVDEGTLDPGQAELIRPYRAPKRFWSSTAGWTAGGLIFIRPELIANPEYFNKVLAHELEHLAGRSARGPPRAGGFIRRTVNYLVSETRARFSELSPASTLKRLAIPLVQRAMRRTGNSLRFTSQPFDVLVINPQSAELSDPEIYRSLSSGKAQVKTVTTTDPRKVLGSDHDASRYGAVVLAKSHETLPRPGSVEAKKLERTLKQLDQVNVLATRMLARGASSFDGRSVEQRRYRELARQASKISRGDKQAADKFEKTVKDFGRELVFSHLADSPIMELVGNLYSRLLNKGLAILPFAPEDHGVMAWERVLSYWTAPDGGAFKVQRVDFENGGHALVVRKVEARVGLWLKPLNKAIAKSIPDAVGSPELRQAAREALIEAGFEDQLERFDKLGLEVRGVFGADVGRQEIYITIPRRSAGAIRNLLASPSVLVKSTRSDFEPHLMNSADLQSVPPVWHSGVTGKSGTILLIGTGGDVSHEDFGERLEVVDLVGEGPEDFSGHETVTSGIAISGNHSFFGMAREAWGIVAKVFSKDSPGAGDGEIKSGIVIGWERADVINASLGSRGSSSDELAQFLSQLTLRKNAKGEYVIAVASNGNAGPFDSTGSQPAAGEHVIAVGAAAKSPDDKTPEISFYSSVGPDVVKASSIRRWRLKPDITAIGGDVTTEGASDVYRHGVTAPKSKDMPKGASDAADGRHTRMSGTSMASPMVAGIALLLKLAIRFFGIDSPYIRENLPFAVKSILMRTADDMGVPLWFMGAGFVNAWAAVSLVSGTATKAFSNWAKSLGRKLTGGTLEKSEDPWAWIARLKSLRMIEDRVYQSAEIARQETPQHAALLADAELSDEPGLKSAMAQAARNQAMLAFEKARREALPELRTALHDPIWLVRFNAALILMNLRDPEAAVDLMEAAANDADARVRQAAFLALAENPSRDFDADLKALSLLERWDTAVYSAYALAKHGDVSSLDRIIAEAGREDKRGRFTSVWLLGQLGQRASSAAAEVLAAKVRDSSERGNIRHLAAAALYNLALAHPQSFTDKVFIDLLEAAGSQNLALTRTIAKMFPEAVSRKPLSDRLKTEPLRTAVAAFVQRNRRAVLKPGALGEMVRQLARHLEIDLDTPTPAANSSGLGVPGVDPAMGDLDILVELPEGMALPVYQDFAGDPGKAEEFINSLGFDGVPWKRLGASPKAYLPLSRAVWVSLPAHKLYAFRHLIRSRGLKLRVSTPQYAMASSEPNASVDYEDVHGVLLAKIWAGPHGISEAKVMASLEALYASVTDPLRRPLLILMAIGGAGGPKSPLSRLVNQLVLHNIGVVAPAGNEGPSLKTMTSPANAGLAVAVTAAHGGVLEPYSSRGTPDQPSVSWADQSELRGRHGTAAAAERTALKLAALTAAMRQKRGEAGLPPGYFLTLTQSVRQSLTAMAGTSDFEAGQGLFDSQDRSWGRLEKEAADPAALARVSLEHAAAASAAYGAALNTLPALTRKPIKDIKALLGEGTKTSAGFWVEPFAFRFREGGVYKARSAGLEGFLYSKLELERTGKLSMDQVNDYFRYLDVLLGAIPWTAEYRRQLSGLSRSPISLEEKSRSLNSYLTGLIGELQEQIKTRDPSQWSRSASIYMILARAYNRLKEGKNFFDSLDDAELNRIKSEVKADTVWLMDIYDIGEIRRWGTGGGSPYSIKGYRIKPELGGEESFKRFAERAHRLGLRVAVDEIPNHVSLDSDEVREAPETLLHIVPPQNLSDEEIMAAVPRHNGSPAYYLVETENYPEGSRRVKKRILLHHPLTDFGGDMWIDMAQRDFSRRETRAWESRELTRLFTELGVDLARRDMSNEVLNVRYFERWKHILAGERDRVSGWAREETDRLLREFGERQAALGGAEYHEESTDALRSIRPDAAVIDELYTHETEMSRSGSSGIYNKNDHDTGMGQIGLYDAMLSRDAGRIRSALRHIAFRRWQKGGAGLVNFIGTHDGGEGNPVDKFGKLFKAMATFPLLLRPTLVYNGLEQGVGQSQMLIGDLSKSVDTAKSIPFDIPVKINPDAKDPVNQAMLARTWETGERNLELLTAGAMEVYEPANPSPIVAASVALGGKTLLVAVNASEQEASAVFLMASPLLETFGAFLPQAEKTYILKDVDQIVDGQPVVFERSGAELLKGLFIRLGGGERHLFEISEKNPNAPILGPPVVAAKPSVLSFSEPPKTVPAQDKAQDKPGRWEAWTQRLTNWSTIVFLAMPIPQIVKNFGNLFSNPEALSILPWMGYSTGILGNMLLLSYFVSQKETGIARVQAVGVTTAAFILGQIFMAGFMPAAAFWLILPAIAAGLAINFLQAKGKLAEKIWGPWTKISGLLGLIVMPQVLWSTFAPAAWASFWPAGIAAAVGIAFAVLENRGKLPEKLKGVWLGLSAWTATILFMYGPVAQLWSNYNNPANLAGISVMTLLLGTAGNLLMLPRAFFTKSTFMSVGILWGVTLGAWAVLLGMFLNGVLSAGVFWALTVGLPAAIIASFALAKKASQEKKP